MSAINCDQELAIDIAESEDMRKLLEQHLRDIGKCLKNIYVEYLYYIFFQKALIVMKQETKKSD